MSEVEDGNMTRADKFEEIFGYRPATDKVLCNEHDYCGESDACNYCMCNPNNIGRDEDWWNAEYKEPTTKNDLGVDCISREQAINAVNMCSNSETILNLQHLPSVTPQEPQTFKWCTDCKEYDQEKHCCHRWSKVIRDTVEEMKQEPKTGHGIDCDDSDDYSADGYDCSVCGVNAEYATSYCPNCGAKMVE